MKILPPDRAPADILGQEHLAGLLRSYRTGPIPPKPDPSGWTIRRLAQISDDEPATLAHVEIAVEYTVTLVGTPYRPAATFATHGLPVTLFDAEDGTRLLARYIQIQRTGSRVFAVQRAAEVGDRERSLVWYGKDPTRGKRDEAFGRFRLISMIERTSEGGRHSLEDDPDSGWRATADLAFAMMQKNPHRKWKDIAKAINLPERTLRKYRRLQRQEMGGE